MSIVNHVNLGSLKKRRRNSKKNLPWRYSKRGMQVVRSTRVRGEEKYMITSKKQVV
jgi:hypothetical protein